MSLVSICMSNSLELEVLYYFTVLYLCELIWLTIFNIALKSHIILNYYRYSYSIEGKSNV